MGWRWTAKPTSPGATPLAPAVSGADGRAHERPGRQPVRMATDSAKAPMKRLLRILVPLVVSARTYWRGQAVGLITCWLPSSVIHDGCRTGDGAVRGGRRRLGVMPYDRDE